MITLTSDFGLRDPYVAEMKGVILTINPNAKIIDITHDVSKFDIRMGAFVLASAVSYFPKGTVHLAVVDPGVGTERNSILVQTKHGFFIGPDNGVLMLASINQGIEHIYQLTNSHLMLPKVSNTFHGRDIFAPAAAHLDLGIDPQMFGAEVRDAVKPQFATVTRRDNFLVGEVLHIDGFGNIITNIAEKQVCAPEMLNLKLAKAALQLVFVKTYARVKPKQAIVLIGSHGFLEIALNQASAAEKFGVKIGDPVEICL